MVELKRGPKAYTYGCFVKALEMYLNDSSDKKGNTTNNNRNHNNDGGFGKKVGDDGVGVGGGDDMEDFLNSCEEHQEGVDDMFGDDGDDDDDGQFTMGLYNGGDNIYELHGDKSSSDDIATEIKAIDSFIIAIKDARKKYSFSGNKLFEILKDKKESCEYFSALLIISEMQTLDLYELASVLVREKLLEKSSLEHTRGDNVHVEEEYSSNFETKYGKGRGQKVKDYAIELANTYYKIRHESII